jgi:hypothetical protein|tara:strand:+ start:267 stop:605 length:339 start_codon:yes stop_codon:yes gene_type:complete
MPKKGEKKTTKTSDNVSKQLVESSVALQDKTAELLLVVNKLVQRLDNMVSVFEEASKHIKSGLDEPIAKRLEELLEQNKNIARGLILLERYVKERTGMSNLPPPKPLHKEGF